ncbi:hypothetical protein [Streptomyces sp. NBC_00459]|uniref:hypothetical protein n=1 Tax=Streptomyces sp. NBC_00459 TaxID=2975749 RepID=UPI002E18B0A0
MSDATDWLSAAGGIVGAIGGPAGLWAAWSQHQQNRRRRYGPPEELVGLLAKIIDVAHDAELNYRNEAWMTASGLEEARARVDELKHLVRDQELGSKLTVVHAQAGLLVGAVASDTDSTERMMNAVAKQSRYASDLEKYANGALNRLRRKL